MTRAPAMPPPGSPARSGALAPADLLQLALEALIAHRLRYALSALAIAVGIAAVVLMTSIGEGTRRFILAQVSAFGTTLVGVHAGHVDTAGIPGNAGGSARKLTIDDARALARLPGVVAATPVAYGSALVESGSRGRRVFLYAGGSQALEVWSLAIAEGRFLPPLDWDRGSAVVVLGARLRRELFGEGRALGQIVRIGTMRFRVIGVTRPKGQFLGLDFDDTAFIPIANAMRLLNLVELGEVNLLAASPADVAPLAARARRLMVERHRRDDVTIATSQDALQMVDRIMGVVTGAVTAIAAISLLVGAIGIFTVLWIVVRERTHEIGLVRALGARAGQILAWYLYEAALTAGVGGAAGLLAGAGGALLLGRVVPGVSATVTAGIAVVAIATAVGVGLVAGVAPALRAAHLDPIEALHAE